MTSPLIRQDSAVHQDDRDRDVADQLDARHEHADQPEGTLVGEPVVVVDVVEDLLVAGLATEGLHGPHAVDRLDEVHDHDGDGLAGTPVRLGGLAAEPPGQDEQEREAEQGDEAELDVEHEQQHSRADQREQGGISPSKPVSSSSLIASTSDVCLEMTRPDVYSSWNSGDSFWKCANTRRRRVRSTSCPIRPASIRNVMPGDGLDHHRHQHGAHDQEQGAIVVVVDDRRDAVVDAERDEERHREPRGVLDHDGDHQQDQQLLVGPQQLLQQPPGPVLQDQRDLVGDLVAILRRHSAPVIGAEGDFLCQVLGALVDHVVAALLMGCHRSAP